MKALRTLRFYSTEAKCNRTGVCLRYGITLWNLENNGIRSMSRFHDCCIQMSLWLEKSLILSVIAHDMWRLLIFLAVHDKGHISGALF